MKKLGFIFVFIAGVTFLFIYALQANTVSLEEKISLAVKKQTEIDNKLQEVENLVTQVRIRVYRKTGF